MTVFTNVPDDVLEPGDPIRSVDILAIKENTNYNHQNTVLEILQEDTFTTSGTFTKATGFDDDDTVMIFLVGGGGSGAASRVTTNSEAAFGGVAGSGVVLAIRYVDFPTTPFTLTAGAGGAAVTRTATGGDFGSNGGVSTLVQAGLVLEANGGNGGRPLSGIFGEYLVGGWSRLITVSFLAPSFVIKVNSIGGASASIFTNSATQAIKSNSDTLLQAARPCDAAAEDTGILLDYMTLPNQVFSCGGSAARAGATNRASWNPSVPAFFGATGGAGSGTANGANATGIGSGGGSCIRNGANAISGAGAGGGMIARYYRGRVSFEQVLSYGA